MECETMKFAIATVAFWEALGYDTANWRKSNDGNQAITELKYAEILGVNLAENPEVKIYFGDSPELLGLLDSEAWHRDGTNGPFDSYNLLEQLAELDTRLTTALANVNKSGITSARPTANLVAGYLFFDTTLGKPIWHNGTAWVDATGTAV